MWEFDIQRRKGAAVLRLNGVEDIGQSLGKHRVEEVVNRFWKFFPNCFSTQSFSILKLKMLNWKEKKQTKKPTTKDQSYGEWRCYIYYQNSEF